VVLGWTIADGFALDWSHQPVLNPRENLFNVIVIYKVFVCATETVVVTLPLLESIVTCQLIARDNIFFFVEQRRRTTRHFIKAEKRYTVQEIQHTPHNSQVQETQHTPHNSHTHSLDLGLQDHHTKNIKTTKSLQALSSRRQRPNNKFLEFGGPR
jgi:hypothetical protein